MSKAAEIGAPTQPLDAFPCMAIDTQVPLYRAGHPDGPWWFNGFSKIDGQTQRFDLRQPHGTCYLATNVETAIREKGRERLLSTGVIPTGLASEWIIYDLTLPVQVRAADTAHGEAVRFGANRELSTVTNPEISCSWAEAFHAASFDGIAYASRFTSQQGWNALALFGDSGAHEWPHANKRNAVQAMVEEGLEFMLSDREGLQIIDPPGRTQ